MSVQIWGQAPGSENWFKAIGPTSEPQPLAGVRGENTASLHSFALNMD